MMGNFKREEKNLFWQISLKDRDSTDSPDGIFTRSNPVSSPQMPPEIALLLPGRHCDPRGLVLGPIPESAALGEFLANPVINVPKLILNLRERGTAWVANLPSLSQHDDEFRQSLSDVALSYDREVANLARIKAAGFKTIATVCTASDASRAVEVGVDALFAMPAVSAFEVGFPSIRHRSDQIESIRTVLPELNIPLLGLVNKAEAAFPTTWPKGLDGAVQRPERL